MDKFICRGKEPIDEYFNGGDWVVGYYTCFNGNEHRIYSGYAETDCGDYYPDWYNVIPETVGRWTTLKDKYGERIFVGDIIKGKVWHSGNLVEPDVVKIVSAKNNCEMMAYCIDYSTKRAWYSALDLFKEMEVIGNIYDNPELLSKN